MFPGPNIGRGGRKRRVGGGTARTKKANVKGKKRGESRETERRGGKVAKNSMSALKIRKGRNFLGSVARTTERGDTFTGGTKSTGGRKERCDQENANIPWSILLFSNRKGGGRGLHLEPREDGKRNSTREDEGKGRKVKRGGE